MNAIERSIQQARTRLFLARSLFHLGRLALVGLAAAAALLLTQRLLGRPIPRWAYAGIGLAAIVVAPLWAWLRQPSIPAAAALIDQRLELKDRLATALYARHLSDDPFAAQVVRDAEQAASGLALARAFPVRPTAIWGWVLTAAALLAVLAVFLPDDLLGLRAARQQAAQARTQAQEQGRREILNAIQVIREIKPAGDPQAEPQRAEDLKGLMDLAEKNLGDPAVRREAMTRIEAVRDQLAQEIDQKRQDLSAMQNAMSQLNPLPGPADRFAAALQRGDYAEALRALDELNRSADSLPPDQREALRQQLVAMANQLGQMSMQNPGGGTINPAGSQGSPQTGGGGNPPQTQPAPQTASNQSQSPQTTQPAQQMASGAQSNPQTQPSQGAAQQQTASGSQQQQPGQQNQSGQQCQNCTQDLSQGLRQMANGMSQPSPNPNSNPNQNQSGNSNQSSNSMQQGAQQASQQLQQLARMQQQMQQMRSQQSQLNQSMGQIAQNCGGGGRNSSFTPNMFQPNMGQNSPDRNNGTGGPKAGRGEGGNPIGQERRITGYNTEAHSQATDGEGRVIASWMENGPMAKNAPAVEFNKSITQARQEAEKAISEDRLPRQYQKAVHDYFNQMPQSPEEIQKPSAPAAPR